MAKKNDASTAGRMTPQEFIQKWQRVSLSERSACQQHFLDLCELLGQPKPAAADPDGAWYTFERGVHKTDGGHGWADAWMRNHFGWEYKGKHKDLVAAYKQLLQYREDLENPPLLVVCDLDRFEIHTNFTGTVKRIHAFDLDGLAEPENLDTLRKLFTEPAALRPGETTEGVTKRAAELIGQIADGMRVRAIPAHDAAHFLMKLMFSMFAEDIGLLKNKVFSKIIDAGKDKPDVLAKRLAALFEAMSTGGYFGADEVLHFNGGLFADAAVIALQPEEVRKLLDVNNLDWSDVEPSVFGTLFERTLDPDKRSQIGAHYTSRADIETLLEPVVMQPLRREWADVQTKCEKLLPKLKEESKKRAGQRRPSKRESKPRRDLDKLLHGFVDRLAEVTILDPACGSGNFLYVALNLLLDLNKEVISYAARLGVGLYPQVRPTQLHGIEINEYAQQLASVVIWIGYLQWMHDNGFTPQLDPVLEPFESIRRMDAILDLSDPEHPKEPEWPAAEFIVGNPPFLGDKLMRAGLGDDYVNTLRGIYSERLPGQSDLCCFWIEKARDAIRRGNCSRAGLLATQGIRGGRNRKVLDRVKLTGDIFWAWSDRDWILDGATVHVSMVGLDDGTELNKRLNGQCVKTINANLTSIADVTVAKRLSEVPIPAFIGVSMHGPFDIDDTKAVDMICKSGNPTGRPNSDVVRPILNAQEIARRPEHRWVVAFAPDSTIEQMCRYSAPFEFVRETVKPIRDRNHRKTYRDRWWIHGESRPAMLSEISRCSRCIATPRVGKHRLFVWVPSCVLPSDATVAFAGDDFFYFGVLHSRTHQVWALGQGTQLRERESGFRYTPTTCFETFPFPVPTDEQRVAIAAAAKELDQLRNRWLNPPEWTRTEVLEFPGSSDGPWRRYVDLATVDDRGIGTVKYPRTVAKDEECAKELKKRTLTNLYNERPTWLDLAHKQLDEAVFAAYGWDVSMSDDDLLAALLALNLERAAGRKKGSGLYFGSSLNGTETEPHEKET
jgi:hypothetical protein